MISSRSGGAAVSKKVLTFLLFCAGLATVLADDKSNIFTQKRLALFNTEKGYNFIGQHYFKIMEHDALTTTTVNMRGSPPT